MLDELTRRVRGWLRGEVAPRVDAPAGRAPDRGVPDAARRLCETGAGALHEGKSAEALALFDAAVAAYPEYAEAHYQAGLALRELGRFEEAVARFQRAIDARHDFVDAIVHQGIAFLELRRYEEAEDSFKLALAHDAGSGETWLHLAMACWNQGREGDAIAHFRRAVDLDPGLGEGHIHLAGLLHAQGRFDEAIESYRLAHVSRPGMPELHVNAGIALLKLGRVDEAAAEFERALALRADFPEASFNLGNARREQDRKDEAIACYERAIGSKPDYSDAYVNLGSVLKDRADIDRALECYERARSLAPDSVEAHHNMGVMLNYLGRPHEAIPCYEQAQKARPGHPESQLNLAIARLQTGDFERGWRDYECRFRQPNPEMGTQARPFGHPRWEGESLAGRSVLVWGEQGVGDEILFSSLYPEVAVAAQRCVIECAPKLVPLFARSFPGARVVAKSDPPHPGAAQAFDFQVPAGSLARWLRPSLASFPERRGHLVPAPERVAWWKARLARLGDGHKVGISWRSTNLKGERSLACTRLEQWGPILAVPGVLFVCLQYDECGAELDEARQRFGVAIHAFPEVDLYNDLDEAAALTQAIDLVISAPTAVSLLSAALGVRTWQMSYGADWQVHGTDRNPWFPAMTQLKRAWNQEWDEVIADIAARLRAEACAAADGDTAAGQQEGGALYDDLRQSGRLLEESRFAEARSELELLVSREPRSAEATLGLARALRGLDKLQEAGEQYERAIELAPELDAAALELGIVRYEQGRIDEADAAYRRLLERDPGHLPARANRALANYLRGDLDAAIAQNEEVLRERPDYAEARFNLGLALLARGEFDRGWQGYEWRFDEATRAARARDFPFPRWAGEDLGGKTILAWKESSVGSQLVFAGMFPELVARAGYCVIECAPKLAPLFARSFPDCDVVPRTEPPHPYTQQAIDFQIPAGSLGRWLRRSLGDFPERSAYLVADPARVAYWRERLRALGPGPKVGFSWRSIVFRGERALACTRIEQWEPVLTTRGATFVSLQYDECAEELARAREIFGGAVHEIREIDMFNDLDEVAALTRALDLVVSAPTAVSVLSAALGVPTWQLHHGTDWQMHGAERHPWLRSLRRFQRGLYQPWEEVMATVAGELQAWITARGSAGG
ncbi:MAG TPA: tetratricopeptide repeat protein [Burkholderiales bacterium]|nr:tetratricopeptide repeat protein [Burkholderiales bacterium]